VTGFLALLLRLFGLSQQEIDALGNAIGPAEELIGIENRLAPLIARAEPDIEALEPLIANGIDPARRLMALGAQAWPDIKRGLILVQKVAPAILAVLELIHADSQRGIPPEQSARHIALTLRTTYHGGPHG